MTTKLSIPNNFLLIGPINAGKYSIRSVLYAGSYTEDRFDSQHMKIVEYENFGNFTRDFDDPEAIKIYVLDVEKDVKENVSAFNAFLKRTESFNLSKVWVFLNKFDLVHNDLKGSVLEKMTVVYKEAASVRGDLSVEIRATSIWDDSLFKVFSEVLISSNKFVNTISQSLNFLAQEVGFDQKLVIFHSKTMTPLYINKLSGHEYSILEGLTYVFKTYQASQRIHSGPDVNLMTIKNSRGLLSSIKINDELIAFVVMKDERVEPFALELTLKSLKNMVLKV